jgi:hypothetical protein
LQDGGFLRQIRKILADWKVVWQAKNISCGLPISGGFDQFCMICFCLVDSGGFEVSISKKNLFLNNSCLKRLVDKK